MGAAVLQAGQYGRVKHFFQILLGQRRALHVGHSSNLHRAVPGICWVHRSLPVLSQVNENLKGRGSTKLIGFVDLVSDLSAEETANTYRIFFHQNVCTFGTVSILQMICIFQFSANFHINSWNVLLFREKSQPQGQIHNRTCLKITTLAKRWYFQQSNRHNNTNSVLNVRYWNGWTWMEQSHH